ncbi:hypothetical protein Bcep18194_B2637 [Burkholderia lata]|uniref:Uncharacterized protein n=1 Tax=Burkholderia lata (strain ATCC 17760 / DSM 23089 / LMG 22485 / NCIMB 9086 / R18194 / 383) TaxID=482957 RepID=Q391W8_BURL3|nr:hypothetical protein Bcep18194_B2637 [Burkholderia lata]
MKGPIGLSVANHCIEGFKSSDHSCDIFLIFIKIALKSNNYDGMFRPGRMDFIDLSFNRARKWRADSAAPNKAAAVSAIKRSL